MIDPLYNRESRYYHLLWSAKLLNLIGVDFRDLFSYLEYYNRILSERCYKWGGDLSLLTVACQNPFKEHFAPAHSSLVFAILD